MLRLKNPSSGLLKGSWCIFEIENVSPGWELQPKLRKLVEEHGGSIESLRNDPSESPSSTVLLKLPHDETDAFGGLLLIALSKMTGFIARPVLQGSRRGYHEGREFRHHWMKVDSTRKTDRTFTQRFVENLLKKKNFVYQLGHGISMEIKIEL